MSSILRPQNFVFTLFPETSLGGKVETTLLRQQDMSTERRQQGCVPQMLSYKDYPGAYGEDGVQRKQRGIDSQAHRRPGKGVFGPG